MAQYLIVYRCGHDALQQFAGSRAALEVQEAACQRCPACRAGSLHAGYGDPQEDTADAEGDDPGTDLRYNLGEHWN